MNVKNLILENEALKEENKQLQERLKRSERIKEGVKLNNGKLTLERNELLKENCKLKNKLANVSIHDLSPEAQVEAGHLLAKDLLGR